MNKYIIIFVLIFQTACTAVVFQPTHKLYYSPEKALGVSPDSFDIDVAENVSLHAWRFKTKSPETKAVIVQFHGNAENISSHYLSVAWLINYGYDLVSFDYRGYGMSSGVSSFPEVVTDSEKVLQFVRKLYGENTPIIVYGQSLGSVIAENAVKNTKLKINQMILEGGVYSLNQVSANVLSKHWVTWLFQPLGYALISHRYNFKKIAEDFPNIPMLLLHSKKDPIVPYKQSEKIYNALKTPKCLIATEEMSHTNIGNLEKGKYRPRILAFLENGQCER